MPALFTGDWGKDGEYDAPHIVDGYRVTMWDGYCHRHPVCYYGKWEVWIVQIHNPVVYVRCNKCGASHRITTLEGERIKVELYESTEEYNSPLCT